MYHLLLLFLSVDAQYCFFHFNEGKKHIWSLFAIIFANDKLWPAKKCHLVFRLLGMYLLILSNKWPIYVYNHSTLCIESLHSNEL